MRSAARLGGGASDLDSNSNSVKAFIRCHGPFSQAHPTVTDPRFRRLGDVAADIVADLTRRRATSSWRST